jgi:hypothetical protein
VISSTNYVIAPYCNEQLQIELKPFVFVIRNKGVIVGIGSVNEIEGTPCVRYDAPISDESLDLENYSDGDSDTEEVVTK